MKRAAGRRAPPSAIPHRVASPSPRRGKSAGPAGKPCILRHMLPHRQGEEEVANHWTSRGGEFRRNPLVHQRSRCFFALHRKVTAPIFLIHQVKAVIPGADSILSANLQPLADRKSTRLNSSHIPLSR